MPQPLEEEIVSGEIGSFVSKYHTFIKDALKNNTIDGAVEGVIRDVCLRGQKTMLLCTGYFGPKVYTNYRMVLSFLNGLIKPECKVKSSVVFSNIDRYVSELEDLMSGDPVFEEFKNAI